MPELELAFQCALGTLLPVGGVPARLGSHHLDSADVGPARGCIETPGAKGEVSEELCELRAVWGAGEAWGSFPKSSHSPGP